MNIVVGICYYVYDGQNKLVIVINNFKTNSNTHPLHKLHNRIYVFILIENVKRNCCDHQYRREGSLANICIILPCVPHNHAHGHYNCTFSLIFLKNQPYLYVLRVQFLCLLYRLAKLWNMFYHLANLKLLILVFKLILV